MDKTTKNVWVWVGVIVLVVLLGMWLMNRNKSVTVGDDSNTPVDQTIDSTEDTTEGSVNATTPAASISYQAALTKYKDARIQLDKTCQASPKTMTFKNGTSIMIDNRAAVARNVKVGSAFSIKAYGFKIVKLSSATLPATWLVDCGTSQNVATILIQK
jgi:hypothetical protein